MVVWLATIMMLSSLHTTDAYSAGPPATLGNLCSDMTPQHGGSSQTSQPPYTITTSATCYTPGQAATGEKTRKVSLSCTFLPRCMECRRGLAMKIPSVRPSVRLSVRPSVRPSVKRVHCDKKGRKICLVFYMIRKIIYPSFLRRSMVGGGTPST